MQQCERTSRKSETECWSVQLVFKENIKLLIGMKKSLTGSSDNLFLTECLMTREKMVLEGLGLFSGTSCFLSLVCPLTSITMSKKQTEEQKAGRQLIF